MDCTNALRTDNVNIMIMDKEFEKRGTCNEVEPWFKTHYNIKGNFNVKTNSKLVT